MSIGTSIADSGGESLGGVALTLMMIVGIFLSIGAWRLVPTDSRNWKYGASFAIAYPVVCVIVAQAIVASISS